MGVGGGGGGKRGGGLGYFGLPNLLHHSQKNRNLGKEKYTRASTIHGKELASQTHPSANLIRIKMYSGKGQARKENAWILNEDGGNARGKLKKLACAATEEAEGGKGPQRVPPQRPRQQRIAKEIKDFTI